MAQSFNPSVSFNNSNFCKLIENIKSEKDLTEHKIERIDVGNRLLSSSKSEYIQITRFFIALLNTYNTLPFMNNLKCFEPYNKSSVIEFQLLSLDF